jgi:PhzF family phenazine biosynthesis protein
MNFFNIIYQVDAFTTKPFKGNPAGVCILEKEPETAWMQNMAMEMNLSETAFVFPLSGNHRTIRFFTPEKEMDICGHATLSSAHILYETGSVKTSDQITFSAKAGELTVNKNGDWITMNFPTYKLNKIDLSADFEKVTGSKPLELYQAGNGWTLGFMKSEKEIRNMKPDFSLMKNSIFGDLMVTANSDDPDYDFCVRCFAPAAGINEDPVTGSANCALAPFWHEKTGKNDFNSHQISKREGILKISLKGNRVEISGQAKTIFKAELFV